jgi:hypothetical protein
VRRLAATEKRRLRNSKVTLRKMRAKREARRKAMARRVTGQKGDGPEG